MLVKKRLHLACAKANSALHHGGFSHAAASLCSQHILVHCFASLATSHGLPNFLDPRGPCAHISCSPICLSLPRFSLYIYLPVSTWYSRLLSTCPLPFNTRVRAVNTYLIIHFKYMSPFYYSLYITDPLLSSFILSTDPLPRVIKCDEPKGSIPLTHFISNFLIVHSVCAPSFKDSIWYYTLLVVQR